MVSAFHSTLGTVSHFISSVCPKLPQDPLFLSSPPFLLPALLHFLPPLLHEKII